MKIKSIYEELHKIVTEAGITVRKDILVKSRGGYCLLDDNKLIILNKTLPIESHSNILARCINELGLHNSEIFITPAVREYIENEIANYSQKENIEFVIKKDTVTPY
jgi:hypothetical protein